MRVYLQALLQVVRKTTGKWVYAWFLTKTLLEFKKLLFIAA